MARRTSSKLTAVAACASVTAVMNLLRLHLAKKRVWVRPWLARREKRSIYYNLVRELSLEDQDSFHFYHRMKREQFMELLERVAPFITKQDTRLRKAVTAQERLSVTLRHLATGESRQSLGFSYRISPNLLSSIIPEVCEAIYQTLQPTYLKMPQTESEWRLVQSHYYSLWQFPNCIGAMDGKRVLLAKLAKPSSTYYDYKSHFSVIMIALVDADCKFLYVDVGGFSRGVWDRCSLKAALEGNVLGIPPPSALPFSDRVCPAVIVADDAFPLKNYLMKPFPGRDLTPQRRNFNYRLSRARRTSKNAFGILSAKFHIFKQPISTSPQNVQKIILATTVLHNFLCTHSPREYAPPELFDCEDHHHGSIQPGVWRQEENGAIRDLPHIPRNPGNSAQHVREAFSAYFENEGQVPWQDRMASLH